MNRSIPSCSVLFFICLLLSVSPGICQTQESMKLENLISQSAKNNDNAKAASYSFELAQHYWAARDFEKAIDVLDDCIGFSKKAKAEELRFLAYQQMGLIYREDENYNKAADTYEKALKVAKGLNNYSYITQGLLNVAESFFKAGKSKKAILPLEEGLSLAIRKQDLALQQTYYFHLAKNYRQLRDEVKAKEYQTLYNNFIERKQNELAKEQALEQLSIKIQHVGAEQKNVNQRLLNNTKKLKEAEDSLLAFKYSLEETAFSLKEEKEINEKRKLEIDLLNKDKELAEMQINEQNAELKHATWIRNSVITGLLLASTLTVVVIGSYRRAVKANKKIEKQNNNIKSSINYAKRIQEAMLPKSEQQQKLLSKSFVLFKPRDSVSGDFYFITEIKNWYNPDVVFAAADCTGHGVPGAFMSMIGINTLNGIIKRGIAEADQILEELDVEIRNTLQQDTTGNSDGMDVALCIYRKEKNIIEFSGAKNPLIYIQNNELFYLKGNVRAVGGRRGKKEVPFQKHHILIDSPTTFYLFSDGYCDQFGKNNEGKFMSKRFKELLMEIHHLPLEEQKTILNDHFEAWKGDTSQIDDVLVMGVKLEPEL